MTHKRIHNWECQKCKLVFADHEGLVCPVCESIDIKKKFGSFEWDLGYKLKRLELRQDG